MNHKLIFTLLLGLFISGSVFTTTDHSNLFDVDLKTSKVMKAIKYKGEIIPHVQLPELVITGKMDRNILVKATLVDGKVYPHFDLQEVVIHSN